MRWLKPAPKQKDKKLSNSFAEATKRQTRRFDSTFARLRRLEDRVAQIEVESSTLRRDVNRVDRKQARETTTSTIEEAQRILAGKSTPPEGRLYEDASIHRAGST